MKISTAVAVLILLVAALLGVPNHQRLTAIRKSHAQLVAAAAQLGISIDPSHPDDPIRTHKRERENKELEAKHAAAEFIAFAKELEALGENGDSADEAQQTRILDLLDRMMSLDSVQLKILIAEFRAAKNLKDETRQNFIGFSIMTLSNDHPQAALALFTESADLFEETGMGAQVISSSLAKWAKDDPLAALEWVKKNNEKFPDLITDDAKRSLISATAAHDPKLAFQLISELGLKETSQTISGIVNGINTSEQRTATLAALREHLATLTDDKVRADAWRNAVGEFAINAAKDSFEAGSKWIESAGFTPEQLASLSDGGYSKNIKSEDTGKWVVWLGKTLPPGENSENGIRRLVSHWTQNDYQAAAKWLSSAVDGPTKNTAIRSYAETIAEYEPSTAAQWALTLPPGKDRNNTLKTIYQKWPADDDDAKEAFKQKHDIK